MGHAPQKKSPKPRARPPKKSPKKLTEDFRGVNRAHFPAMSTTLQQLAALSSYFEDKDAIELMCLVLASKAEKNFLLCKTKCHLRVTFLTSRERNIIESFIKEKFPLGQQDISIVSRQITFKVKTGHQEIRKLCEQINKATSFTRPICSMLPEKFFDDGRFCKRIYRDNKLMWTVFDNTIFDNIGNKEYELIPTISIGAQETDIGRYVKDGDVCVPISRMTMKHDEDLEAALGRIKAFLQRVPDMRQYLNTSKRKAEVEEECRKTEQRVEKNFQEQLTKLKEQKSRDMEQIQKKRKIVHEDLKALERPPILKDAQMISKSGRLVSI